MFKDCRKEICTSPSFPPSLIVFGLGCHSRNVERPGKGLREIFASELENTSIGCFKKLEIGVEEN